MHFLHISEQESPKIWETKPFKKYYLTKKGYISRTKSLALKCLFPPCAVFNSST